jgi:hypothetical protein
MKPSSHSFTGKNLHKFPGGARNEHSSEKVKQNNIKKVINNTFIHNCMIGGFYILKYEFKK